MIREYVQPIVVTSAFAWRSYLTGSYNYPFCARRLWTSDNHFTPHTSISDDFGIGETNQKIRQRDRKTRTNEILGLSSEIRSPHKPGRCLTSENPASRHWTNAAARLSPMKGSSATQWRDARPWGRCNTFFSENRSRRTVWKANCLVCCCSKSERWCDLRRVNRGLW